MVCFVESGECGEGLACEWDELAGILDGVSDEVQMESQRKSYITDLTLILVLAFVCVVLCAAGVADEEIFIALQGCCIC